MTLAIKPATNGRPEKIRGKAHVGAQPVVRLACVLAAADPQEFIRQLDWSVGSDLSVLDEITPQEGMATPFQSGLWLEAWLKTLGAGGQTDLRIVRGRLGSITLIAIPLCLKKSGPFSRAMFVAQDVSDYNHPVFHAELAPHVSGALMGLIWRHAASMLDGADILSLRKLLVEPDNAASYSLWRPQTAEPDDAHWTALHGDWAQSGGRFFGESSRRSLARKEKKLAAGGALVTETISDPEERVIAMRQLADWKKHQLNQLHMANPFARAGLTDFLEQIARFGDPQKFRLYRLSAGGCSLALTLMICGKTQWFLYQTAYTDADARRFSPGLLLLRDILKGAHDAGIEMFDFGLGNENYKQKYCDRRTVLYRSQIAMTVKGQAALIASDVKFRLRSALKSNSVLRRGALIALRWSSAIRARGGNIPAK